jgi:hypothetical protein
MPILFLAAMVTDLEFHSGLIAEQDMKALQITIDSNLLN